MNKGTIGEFFTLVGGGTPSTKISDYWGEGYPWISSSDIKVDGKVSFNKFVTKEGIKKSATNLIPKGTIVVVTRVGMGKVCILPQDMCFSQDMQALVPRDASMIYAPFFEYQLRNLMSIEKYKGQGTTISGITKKHLSDLPLIMPSVDEQERIVARIEELFSELDNAEETLQATKQQLAVYRQAVLKSVFSDVENKDKIRNVSSVVTSGSRGWAKYYSDHGAKFIRIGNLTHDRLYIDLSDIQYVDLPELTEGRRTRLNANDVLVSITADLGSIGLVPEGIGEAYVNQHIAMIRFNNANQGELYAWYLRSDYGQKDLLKNKRGGGKLGLGLDDIRDTYVPIVSDSVAKYMVDEIEARLSVCDSIELTVNNALQELNSMRQSILKEAFEGRL